MTILDTMHHDTHTPHPAMIDYGRALLTPPRFALRADEPHPAMIDYGRERLTPPRFALRGDAEQLITHTTLQTPCRLMTTGARGSLRRALPYALMSHTPR